MDLPFVNSLSNIGDPSKILTTTAQTAVKEASRGAPWLLSVTQQMGSFCLLNSLVRGGIYKGLSLFNEVKYPRASFIPFPTVENIIRVGMLAGLSAFMATGEKSLHGWPFVDPDANNKQSFHSCGGFLEGGMIGLSHSIQENYTEEFLPGLTVGQGIAWGIDVLYYVGFSTAINTLGLGLGFSLPFILGAAAIGGISSIATAHIAKKLGDQPADANALRQMFFFCVNGISSITRGKGPTGQLFLSAESGLGLQMVCLSLIVGATYYLTDQISASEKST